MAVRATAWLVLALAITIAACDRGATAEPPDATPVLAPGGDASDNGLLVGVYRLAADPVIDGDTIRVEGIKDGLRLLFLDTEEPLDDRKNEKKAVKDDFAAYLERKRGNATRPVKPYTPMGDEASRFAKRFFKAGERVRLERDHPDEAYGRFGRTLAYVSVRRNGRWVPYNEACIRAGMSPYFTKYGYSRRFGEAFAEAEAEARKAQRGIWHPEAEGYGDYDERRAWWNARADFIRAFEREAEGRDDFVILSRSNAEALLETKLGREVTVLATIGEIRRYERLVNVSLDMRPGRPFPLIFFDRALFEKSGLGDFYHEPIRARGVIEAYERGSYRTLQIVVKDASQITLPELPPVR